MKTCKVCGALVDDREWNCPECGATMITSGGTLSLKANEPEKKKAGHTLGTTVSTGSGLTDILRADTDEVDDNPVIVGSVPMTYSKNYIDEEEARKKAKANRRLIGNIFKVIFVLALALLVYLYVTKVIMAPKGADSYNKMVDTFVEAVNDNDVTLMKTIMPKFLSNQTEAAEDLLKDMDGVKIISYEITSKEEITRATMDILTDEIKLDTGKNANLNEGYYLEVQFVINNSTDVEKTVVVTMDAYRVKNLWYLYLEDFDVRAFQ